MLERATRDIERRTLAHHNRATRLQVDCSPDGRELRRIPLDETDQPGDIPERRANPVFPIIDPGVTDIDREGDSLEFGVADQG